jgi:hypothetical protein
MSACSKKADKPSSGVLGFDGVEVAATGRPSCHPSVLLKPYIYSYLNCVRSSYRFERGQDGNVDVAARPENISATLRQVNKP